MLIYPAIDLMGGCCVRLSQGDRGRVTRYVETPAELLSRFAASGASWAHIVDLDGAEKGLPVQHNLVAALAKEAPVSIQASGGIRDASHVEMLFEAGVSRVVIGSLAVTKSERVNGWIKKFGPSQIVLAFDVQIVEPGEPMVATHGWRRASTKTLWSLLDAYADSGLEHILVTDISRDGMLSGPNVALVEEIVCRWPAIKLQASGGVGSLEDVAALRSAGADAAIIGKAIYEARVDLAEAIRAGA
ncbi:MAG: 1-(5-phosphoribosyl)-5-[(5-phosphoribosylamino)methylideneamino]imidazole-4-carboxamide isomerase [Parvularculaceae bacterium]